MKKIFFILLISLFSSAMWALTETTPSTDLSLTEAQMMQTEYESVYLNRTQKVIPKKYSEKNEALHYEIQMTYPQIEGEALSAPQKTFNEKMKHIVENEIQQFKQSVALDAPHMKTLPVEALSNTLRMDYDLDILSSVSFVSVRFTIEGKQAGRAHPYHAHRVLNYDLANNKVLELGDLFKPKTPYLKTLAAFSMEKLNKNLPEKDQWMVQEGTKALPQNYKNWSMGKTALLITFEEYQVAPYVYGPQEVEIPYTTLQMILSPQGILLSKADQFKNALG